MGIDSTIEDHRRDPDPHPRLKRRLDEIDATISALTPGSPALVLSDTHPADVSTGAPSAGTSPQAARGDHRHRIVLPAALDSLAGMTGDGVVMRDPDGTHRATQAPSVTGRITGGTLAASDQAGTGERIVLADADGVQRAEDKLQWAPGEPDIITPGGGITWTSQTVAGVNTNFMRRAAYGDGVFIVAFHAQTADGAARSTDGVTWTPLQMGPLAVGYGVQGLAYGNGIWLATLNHSISTLARSFDGGLTWDIINIGFGSQNSALAFGNGRWVFHSGGSDDIRYSDNDGGSWSSTTLPTGLNYDSNQFQGQMIYANGIFVLLARRDSTTYWTDIFTSSDGATWVLCHTGPTGSKQHDLAYGDGVWVSVGEDSIGFRSTDNGVTWTQFAVDVGTTDYWGVAFKAGIFIAVKDTGGVRRSVDGGVTWTTETSTSGCRVIVSSDDLFVAAGNNAYFMRSATGLTPGTDDGLELGPDTTFTVSDHGGAGNRLIYADNTGRYHDDNTMVRTTEDLTIDGTPLRQSLTSAISYAWMLP